MADDAPSTVRRDRAMIVIVIAVIVAIVATIVALTNRDDDAPAATGATAPVLTVDSAHILWNRLTSARDSCNMTEFRAVATESFIDVWKDELQSTTDAEACDVSERRAQFKSTTKFGTPRLESFSESSHPIMVIEYPIEIVDLLGNIKGTRFDRLSIEYVKGSDGYWRVDNTRFL